MKSEKREKWVPVVALRPLEQLIWSFSHFFPLLIFPFGRFSQKLWRSFFPNLHRKVDQERIMHRLWQTWDVLLRSPFKKGLTCSTVRSVFSWKPPAVSSFKTHPGFWAQVMFFWGWPQPKIEQNSIGESMRFLGKPFTVVEQDVRTTASFCLMKDSSKEPTFLQNWLTDTLLWSVYLAQFWFFPFSFASITSL